MKTIKLLLLTIVASVFFTACTAVPPAHYGKKMSMAGYSDETLPPGRYWMWITQSMVLLDGSSKLVTLPLGVTMKDTNVDGSDRIGLEMDFEVAIRYKLKPDPKIINTIFNDIKVTNNEVTATELFSIYGKTILENKVREILATYTPEEALANREPISNRINLEIKELFKNKPIDVYDIVLTKMVLPAVIKQRIAANKERELRLAEAQAQQRIDLEKRDNEIILAKKEAEKRIIDARAAGAENKVLNEGLTDKVLDLRKLEIQKTYADAWKACMESDGKCGSNTIYMPFEALQSTGGNIRVLSK